MSILKAYKRVVIRRLLFIFESHRVSRLIDSLGEQDLTTEAETTHSREIMGSTPRSLLFYIKFFIKSAI